MESVNMGIISVLPAFIAIALAFATRNTVISLMIAIITGTFLAGEGILGFPGLLRTSIGTTGFAWVMLLNTFIGVLVAFFQKTGAIQGFSQYMNDKNLSRKSVQIVTWLLGFVVYFSDSFSPLFAGATMRKISDKAKISREKLSYIADSGAAPVSVLVPITGWAAFLSGLAIGVGNIENIEDAMSLFIRAIPYNFYALITVVFVGLIASGIIKDFGPMKKAEERAMNEGKVLRDGAIPLVGKELTEMEAHPGIQTRVVLNFLLPVLMIIAIALTTHLITRSAKTMEAFLIVIIFMSISMRIQGIPLKDIMDAATDGIKGAVPAVMILALAYTLKSLSVTMGTADYIIQMTEGFITPQVLPAITFLIAAFIAFSTGTSWGTFAITMPIALPLAFALSGGQVSPLVMASFAAVAGGGVFGDHCSPLSDTTILASTGAAADHIDHVKTQLPYALITGGLALAVYLIIGFVSM